jgi:hypothetical protein
VLGLAAGGGLKLRLHVANSEEGIGNDKYLQNRNEKYCDCILFYRLKALKRAPELG